MPMPQNNFENGIRIQFWVDDHVHAERYSLIVPAIGDEVRFNDVPYKVHYRIFIYDEPAPRVAINMEAVEQTREPDAIKAKADNVGSPSRKNSKA